jgi:predicted component of viral defense system (DUF524 family)
MSDTVLRCGNLTVRSKKALERLETAQGRSLDLNKAQYRISGFIYPGIITADICYLLKPASNGTDLETDKNCQAIFFDQTPYTFIIQFPLHTKTAQLFSPIAAWCDASSWDEDSDRLTIPINFGNDLGDFQLTWEWQNPDDEWQQASLSGQVFSTKLDITTHFDVMLDEVKSKYNWIKLDLLRQTTWGWTHDTESDRNQRTWLLIFQEVRVEMGERLRKLVEQHRRRLVEETHSLRADQMKKISPCLEEAVAEGLRDNPNKRYSVSRRVLDADTPENRYIKHVLSQTIIQLNEINNQLQEHSRFSDIFKRRIQDWVDEWSILKEHRFWRGIGPFRGLRRASLILSQDPIYAGIRRSYFLLQQGLRFFEQELKGGIQNAAQLYEVWCFVKLDQLIRSLNWDVVNEEYDNSTQNDDSLSSEKEDLSSGFAKCSYHKQGLNDVELTLLFQPSAGASPSRKGWDDMVAYPVAQNPDLVLRLQRNDLPRKPVYTWIFDAKYRINNNNAPDDAVNQMHRYRDAIVWSKEAKGAGPYLREGIGAYVLYPGDDNDKYSKYSQIDSIKKTNIGAFPLKPIRPDYMPAQLKNHVKNLLDISQDEASFAIKEDSYYYPVPRVKRPDQQNIIKCVTRHRDKMDTPEYWEKCRLYRLPVKEAEKQKLDVYNIGYLIPVDENGTDLGSFPIKDIEIKKRIEINQIYESNDVNMYNKPESANNDYYLFTLGEKIKPISNILDIPRDQVFIVDDSSTLENQKN